MKNQQQQNYYELLDITVEATSDDIVRAYNKARAAYSGNSPALYSLFSKQEAEEILKLVDEAFSVLSNQFKRKEYNKKQYPELDEKKEVKKTSPAPPLTFAHKKNFQDQNPFVQPRKTSTGLIPLDGIRNVSVKKKVEYKLPAGITRWGRYEVDEEFEKKIGELEEFTGDILQQIRTYKGISLDQISDYTKVSRAYLVAIETSDYSGLPAPVYLRGFLYQLAKSLNLEPTKVCTTYLKIMVAGMKK